MKWTRLLIVKSLIAAVVVIGPVARTLQAQSNLAITATIPFPFLVGTRSITSGSYQFSLIGDSFLLSVLNLKTGHQEFFPVHPGGQQAFEPDGCLTFQKFESSSVLTDVHFYGTDTVTEVNGPHRVHGPRATLCSKSEPLTVVQR